ncbi:3',5'-cyclic AMP phosphodiesterase CpdA [Halorhabdus sp. SVX81]|uniref:metallophosphoesterase family protein n=1 Tax=Halorhabdus sp. SVX81 TaxID=2978283 RepID=UPI0023DCB595|nr:metallophosphoesterase [Halorhabdus sp. SVX81]WEL17641.1 3',5'-cyclic AMP phosphodiesterase CpdA [Halorhabdus sp. SVX81]
MNGDDGHLLARLPTLTTADETRLGVVADPHLSTRAQGTWKCYHRTETFLSRAVAGIQSASPDATVVAGDLTKDGEPANFDRYDELVAPLSSPLTVPGNHDVPKSFVDHEVLPVEDFADRYTRDGYPFRERVGGLDVYCLNSAATTDGSLRDTWGGRVSQDQLDWLAERLDGPRVPVVVVHHNLFAQPEHTGGFWRNFPLQNADALQDVLTGHGPVLVVSGHHHIPSVQRDGDVHEVIAPALCSYPPSYLLINVGPKGTTVRRMPVTTPAERTEAYTLGATGTDLGQAVVTLAADRVGSEPQ